MVMERLTEEVRQKSFPLPSCSLLMSLPCAQFSKPQRLWCKVTPQGSLLHCVGSWRQVGWESQIGSTSIAQQIPRRWWWSFLGIYWQEGNLIIIIIIKHNETLYFKGWLFIFGDRHLHFCYLYNQLIENLCNLCILKLSSILNKNIQFPL